MEQRIFIACLQERVGAIIQYYGVKGVSNGQTSGERRYTRQATIGGVHSAGDTTSEAQTVQSLRLRLENCRELRDGTWVEIPDDENFHINVRSEIHITPEGAGLIHGASNYGLQAEIFPIT